MCASCPQPNETCTAVYSCMIQSWLEPLHGIFQDALQSSPYTCCQETCTGGSKLLCHRAAYHSRQVPGMLYLWLHLPD